MHLVEPLAANTDHGPSKPDFHFGVHQLTPKGKADEQSKTLLKMLKTAGFSTEDAEVGGEKEERKETEFCIGMRPLGDKIEFLRLYVFLTQQVCKHSDNAKNLTRIGNLSAAAKKKDHEQIVKIIRQLKSAGFRCRHMSWYDCSGEDWEVERCYALHIDPPAQEIKELFLSVQIGIKAHDGEEQREYEEALSSIRDRCHDKQRRDAFEMARPGFKFTAEWTWQKGWIYCLLCHKHGDLRDCCVAVIEYGERTMWRCPNCLQRIAIDSIKQSSSPEHKGINR